MVKLSKYFLIIFTFISIRVMLFSVEIFDIFIDKKYSISITVVPWIILGMFFLGLANFIVSIYSYKKQFKEIGIIAFVAAVINIFLNFILIPNFGMTGAAIASLTSYALYFGMLLIGAKQEFKRVFSLRLFMTLILIVVFISVFTYSINILHGSFNLSIFVLKLSFVILMIISLFIFKVVNKEEKQYVLNLINNIFLNRPK